MRVETTTAKPVLASLNEQNSGSVAAASGAIAGLVAGTVVCPFDVVKTRLQVHSAPNTIKSTFKQIYLESGFKGFYSGLTPLLVGYLPSWTIYFYVYKRAQHFAQSNNISHNLSNVPSSVVAGACSTLATNPIWMVKTRMMSQSRESLWQYSSMMDACKKIYKNEGILTFYSGLTAALLGLPHVAIHFPLYEYLKQRWAPKREYAGFLAASMVSKVIASTVTYPHEVIRSRAQIQTKDNRYNGIMRTIRSVYNEGGIKLFYAGLLANIFRALPASAVTLLTFELVSHTITEYEVVESYE